MSYWTCQCRSYICLFGLKTSFFFHVFSSPRWRVGRRALNSALIALRHVTCTVTVSIAPIRRCGSISPPWCLITQRVPFPVSSVSIWKFGANTLTEAGQTSKLLARACYFGLTCSGAVRPNRSFRPSLFVNRAFVPLPITLRVNANFQMNRWKYRWLATRVSLSGGREKHG